jgi:peptidoglycan/xylan/chitin deacetylase (PgdA/CDA1 family)
MFGWQIRRRIGFSFGHWLPIAHAAPAGANSIALSFDDGPSPRTTPGVVELLRAYGAKATFFLSGERAERHIELAAQLVENGCAIYAHGYSHVRMDRIAPEEALKELERTESVLARVRPTPEPYLVRLPYGSGHRVPRVHRLLRHWRSDCQLAHWDYSPEDFKLGDGCRTRADLERNCDAAVTAAFANPSFPGSVVLLHEDPYDASAPHSAETACVLLERVLAAAKVRGIAVTGMAPVGQSWLQRYVRTVPMD